MEVGKRMTTAVVTVGLRASVGEARELLTRHRIRHLPVVENGRLVGIVAEPDVRMAEASPPADGPRLVADLMINSVITVGPETSIERAAMLMADNKIGALPVVNDDDEVIGILTESDVLNVFLDVMGVGSSTARLELLLPDRPGALLPIAEALAREGVNIESVVTTGGSEGRKVLIIRVAGADLERTLGALEGRDVEVLSAEEAGD